MNAEKCRIFLEAVKLGSMSATSAALGYTPSGISYIIDMIEDEIGLKLVNRSPAGISLTHAGVRMMPFLKDFVHAETVLHENAKSLRDHTSGEITIGTFPSIGRLILPDLIQAYHDAFPGVKINIVEGINEQLEPLLVRKEVDFCICSIQLKHYDWFPLHEDALVCVFSPQHPLAVKDSITAEDIHNENFILSAYGRDSDILDLFKRLQIEPRIVSRTLENSSAFAMVSRNMGITIVNELGTIGESADVVIRPFSPPQSIIEGIILRSYKDASPMVQNFIDFLRPRIRNMAI